MEDSDLFLQESICPGDETSCFNPFMQVVKMAPDRYPQPYSKYNIVPKADLALKYVYGYRCFDGVTHSAKFIKDDKIIFIQAGLGVILKPDNT